MISQRINPSRTGKGTSIISSPVKILDELRRNEKNKYQMVRIETVRDGSLQHNQHAPTSDSTYMCFQHCWIMDDDVNWWTMNEDWCLLHDVWEVGRSAILPWILAVGKWMRGQQAWSRRGRRMQHRRWKWERTCAGVQCRVQQGTRQDAWMKEWFLTHNSDKLVKPLEPCTHVVCTVQWPHKSKRGVRQVYLSTHPVDC